MTGIVAGNFLDAAEWMELLMPVLVALYLCRGIPKDKRDWLNTAIDFVLVLAVMLLVRVPIMIYGRGVYTEGRTMLVPVTSMMALGTSVVSYIYLRLRSQMRKGTVLLLSLAMYACSSCLFIISGQFSFFTGEIFGRGLTEGVVRCVLQFFQIPISVYLRRKNFDDYTVIPTGGVRLLLCGDVALLVLSILEGYYSRGGDEIKIIMVVVFTAMLFIMLASIRCIHAMCVEQTQLIDLQAERQRSHSEQEMLEWMDDNLDSMRHLRHDLKNQYAYMQILLEQGKYEELKEYFGQMTDNLPLLQGYVDCGNSNMNTLLNLMYSKAKARNVKLSFQLVVPPVLPFKTKRLCSLIGNLVDNAIEECARLQKAGREDVGIQLSIYPQKSYLVICCKNTTDKQRLTRSIGGLRTTKKDEQIHGYGTRIVSRIAEKYNGLAEFQLEGEQFVAKVMLDMMTEEAK